jgi:AsmA family protein
MPERVRRGLAMTLWASFPHQRRKWASPRIPRHPTAFDWVMKRSWKWLFGGLVVAAAVGAGAVLSVQEWGGPAIIRIIQARASADIGRPITIGSVHIHPGRIATITLDHVAVANPPGWPASDPPLAEIPRLVMQVNLWDYLRHHEIVVPSVDIQDPHLFVAEAANKQANYRLRTGPSHSKIGVVRIEGGQVHAVLAPLRANFQIAIRTEQPPGKPGRLFVTARGTYADQPIEARFVGGALLAAESTTVAWPVDLSLRDGATTARLQGEVTHPLALSGARLRLAVAGPSLSALRPLTGIALPQTSPYRASGILDIANQQVNLHDIAGVIGSSDLEGAITVTPDQPRPVVRANLFSRSVNLADLGGVVGGTPPHEGHPATNSVLPEKKLSVPQFHYANVYLRYRAAHIQGRSMPLDNLAVNVDVVNGNILVRPFSFGIGGGQIAGRVELQPVGQQVQATAEVNFERVALSKLMSTTHTFQGMGTINGSASIRGTGDSVAAILGHADGKVTFGMTGGNLSGLLVDLSGLEFGNALLSALGMPNKKTPIECMVADFDLQRGLLTSRALLVDTGDAIVRAAAQVSLYNQSMHIVIRTEPKHISIASLPGPVEVNGTLKHPHMVPSVQTVVRGAAAAALAVIFPPLAALPTIQFPTSDQGRCQAVLAAARQQAPGTKPPPPRTTTHQANR